MAFLEQFSDEERELLISLPYRAGLWVSSVDDTGGAKADYEELDELESIVVEKASGMFESAFVHEVMAETCTRQQDWKKWAEGLDAVPNDCKKAIAIISGKLAEKDIDAFRANVMSISLSVAKAFREFDDGASMPVKLFTQIRLFLEAVMRFLKRDKSYDTESVLNISYEEDVALSMLSKALHDV